MRSDAITDKYTRQFFEDHHAVCAAQYIKLGPLFLPFTYRQLCFYLLAMLGLFLFALWDYKKCYTVLTFVLCAFYGVVVLFRLISVALALGGEAVGRPAEHRPKREDTAALKDIELPVYTILVPMFKEPEVAQKIARAVTSLDYPIEKLDVKLLLEEDDPETRAKISEVMDELPACVEVIVCPTVSKGEPRTKPRACNWGLDRAKGEYLVIYDAEDRPESDQLKKAVATFNKLRAEGRGEKVVCLQAKLNYFNARQNSLTRFFTLEYTTWYDLFLPGLHALRTPIPLGGTSNHFSVKVLKDLGGWDPFNVTEDCDLGMRLARRGYQTEILDSTTWEEANSQVMNWIKQRSRWVKGYFQSHLVHTRDSVWPFFMLSAAMLFLADKVSESPGPETLGGGEMGAFAYLLAATLHFFAQHAVTFLVAGGVAAGGLGLWTAVERLWQRGRGTYKEGRFSHYGAASSRLTVGGLSAMLILNLVFWSIACLYLFRMPIAEVLPGFMDVRIESQDNMTLSELLRTWELYHTRVTNEEFHGYTVWRVLSEWLVSGEMDGETAERAFAAIDDWSYWSQILYPMVIVLFMANFVFVAMGLISCAKRKLWDLTPFALLMPFYWVLISIAAIKGAWQLFWNPFYWEKTVHGLDHGASPGGGDGPGSDDGEKGTLQAATMPKQV